MGKHKKTRKEKIITDLRHQLYTLQNKDLPSTDSSSTINNVDLKKNIDMSNSSTAVISYAYLKNEVLKTLTVTLSIIALQIILLFMIQKHIIVLPGINY